MNHIAPPLGKKGFAEGCSQPGQMKPPMQTVTLGTANITFTSNGVLLSSSDPAELKQLQDAATAVGDTRTRISQRS